MRKQAESPGQGPSNPVATGRRRFINWLLAASGTSLFASVLYPIARFVSPPDIPEATTNEVEAGATNDPELLEKGYKIIRFGVEPVIVVRAGENAYRAMSATCTHLDCIVEFQKEKGRIWCNCHNGEYDLSGRNIAGPPPKPLVPYKVDVVTRSAGQPGIIVVSKA